jgi:glycosyltransferase involved in cell wall biosynthesis
MNRTATPPETETGGVGEHPRPEDTRAEPFGKVIVAWGMDAWDTFHRREMLQALIANISPEFALLLIEPHYHATYLVDKKLDEVHRLADYALLRPRNPFPGVYSMRLLTMGFPAGMPVDPLLTEDISLGAKAEKIARQLFGQGIAIIHWIYKPYQRDFIPVGSEYIYEVYDDDTLDFGTGKVEDAVVELEPRVIGAARHVFFTSKVLAARKAACARAWTVVENGVDFSAFRRRADLPGPNAANRPRVGYLGNLSDFFDWEAMFEVCRGLPEMDFVLHGQIEWHRLEGRVELAQALLGLPNVESTGRVSRSVGAASVARCDVLVIPFVVNDAMHAVNPLKLWEYFAVGVPVVSSPMLAIDLPEPILRVARTADEWVAALRSAVNERDAGLAERRVAMARGRDWSCLTRTYAKVLLEF